MRTETKRNMRTETALKRLEELGVDPIQVGSIRIQHGHGRINICLVVARIIHQFNSDQKTEDEVCEILRILLKRHF